MMKRAYKNKEVSNVVTLLIMFVIIAAFLGIIIGKSMYTPARMRLMGFQIPEFGLIALGMTFSFLLGGIDLSLVANANLSGILCAYVLSGRWFSNLSSEMAIIVGIAIALIVSICCGFINGMLVAKCSVPPMIATLGTMTFFKGVAMAMTGGESVTHFPDAFNKFSVLTVSGIPVIFVLFVAITVALHFSLSRSSLGRTLCLYGENPIASRFCAINNEKILFMTFMLNGVLAGLAGLTIISRVTTAKVGYGDAYLVQAMLVAIIGGVSPSGGRGRITGVMIAIAITQLLSSAFTIWQLSPYNRKLIWGALLILVIVINHFTSSLKHRRNKK